MYTLNGHEQPLPVGLRPPTQYQYKHRINPVDLGHIAQVFGSLPVEAIEGVQISVHKHSLFIYVDMSQEALARGACKAQTELITCRQDPGIPIGSQLDILARTFTQGDYPSLSGWEGFANSMHCSVITGACDGVWCKAVEIVCYVSHLQPLRQDLRDITRMPIMVTETGHAAQRWDISSPEVTMDAFMRRGEWLQQRSNLRAASHLMQGLHRRERCTEAEASAAISESRKWDRSH
jgi:hypothetical protein